MMQDRDQSPLEPCELPQLFLLACTIHCCQSCIAGERWTSLVTRRHLQVQKKCLSYATQSAYRRDQSHGIQVSLSKRGYTQTSIPPSHRNPAQDAGQRDRRKSWLRSEERRVGKEC